MKGFVALSIAVAMLSDGSASAQTPDPNKVEAGQTAFKTFNCGTCHGTKPDEKKMASTLAGVGKKLSEADMRKWLTDPAAMEAKLNPQPKAKMSTAMKSKKLTDADVDALVAYMMSLK